MNKLFLAFFCSIFLIASVNAKEQTIRINNGSQKDIYLVLHPNPSTTSMMKEKGEARVLPIREGYYIEGSSEAESANLKFDVVGYDQVTALILGGSSKTEEAHKIRAIDINEKGNIRFR